MSFITLPLASAAAVSFATPFRSSFTTLTIQPLGRHHTYRCRIGLRRTCFTKLTALSRTTVDATVQSAVVDAIRSDVIGNSQPILCRSVPRRVVWAETTYTTPFRSYSMEIQLFLTGLMILRADDRTVRSDYLSSYTFLWLLRKD